LNIHNENVLVQLFEKYLKHRETLPILPEEDPMNDTTHLTPEEVKARGEAKAAVQEEEKKQKEEETKAKEDAYNALDDLHKANKDWEIKVEAVHA
jgi:hypothetical protein